MKKLSLIILLFLLAGCAAPSEPVQPTSTPLPSDTPEPSPTPTPVPYFLEEGVLLDWDDSAGDYVVVAEEIDVLTTTTDGEIVAVDGSGNPRFVFNGDIWEELKVDPNYGFIVGVGEFGRASLPMVKDWWENYKEKMPTNEDVKWLTYEDGSRVELGEIPNFWSRYG